MRASRRRRGSVNSVPPPATSPSSPIGDWLAIAILIASVALVTYVRLRLAGIPLERDEGEYAYAGRLILEGVPPYAAIYNMKFPGTYYAYAALMTVFGQSPWGIRVGLLCIHLLTVGALFVLARRLTSTRTAAFAASAFALLAVDRWSLALFAHATHFALLPALLGLIALTAPRQPGAKPHNWRYLIAGAMMAVALCMKQQALFFGVAGFVLAGTGFVDRTATGVRWSWRRAALFVAGGAVVGQVLLIVVALQGVLVPFWQWTVNYGLAYISETPFSLVTTMFAAGWNQITHANAVLWWAAAVGAGCLVAGAIDRPRRAFVLVWLTGSLLALTPGFFFRPHYFVLLMPVAGLLIGILVSAIERPSIRFLGTRTAACVPALAFLVLAGPYVFSESRYFVGINHGELIRSLYQTNPFLEAPIVGEYLQSHSSEEDTVAVLGSEPEILFYANRRSATGFIYMYPLMEPQPLAARMQQDIRREIMSSKPAYLVLVGIPTSWGTRADSDTSIQRWAGDYANACYDQVGLTNIDKQREPRMYWGVNARDHAPEANATMLIYKRKRAGACG